MSLPDSFKAAYLLGAESIEIRDAPLEGPGPGEILVEVGAATTCGTDLKVFRRGGHPRMLLVPGRFGHEFAGTVAAVGTGVSRWKPGHRVVVANSAPCGVCDYCREARENLCTDLEYLNGAFAEYVLVPRRFVDRNTHLVAEGVPFEIAALTEPLACVLHGIECCGLDGPADIAVYGAGPIGLLFVGALAADGHRVVLADVNPARLEVGAGLGAAVTVVIAPGGKQSETVRKQARRPGGFDLAVDATGVPEVWVDVMASVRPGGTANLFGGCAPGTSVPLDTHLVHYSELTIKGVYHHRPATVAAALAMLSRGGFEARLLLGGEMPLAEVGAALAAMGRGEMLKVVIRP
jgi:L-iditol 2-dehydrogenase